MPSSYTTSARFTLQATGENNNTWGVILNSGVFQLVDDNINGRLAFNLSGPKALTTALGATDEGRMAFLDVLSGTGGTVTAPAVTQGRFVRNATAGDVTLSAGGLASATFKPGDAGSTFCDGSNVYPMLIGGRTVRAHIDFMLASAPTTSPPVVGKAGMFLGNDGVSALEWQTSTPLRWSFGGVTSSASALINLGPTAPPAPIDATVAVQVTGATGAAARMEINAFGSSAQVNGRAARGTAAAPTATLNNDYLFFVTGRGYGATGWAVEGAALGVAASENFTNAAQGTRLDVFTTNLGTTALTPRWSFTAPGDLAPVVTNTYDLGSAATRVRSGYFATQLSVSQGGVPPTPFYAASVPVFQGHGDSVTVELTSYAALGPSLLCRRAGGTPAAPAATPTGYAIGSIGVTGRMPSGWKTNTAGTLYWVTTENWTDTAQGCASVWAVTPNGTTTALGMWAVENNGNLLPLQSVDIGSTGNKVRNIYAGTMSARPVPAGISTPTYVSTLLSNTFVRVLAGGQLWAPVPASTVEGHLILAVNASAGPVLAVQDGGASLLWVNPAGAQNFGNRSIAPGGFVTMIATGGGWLLSGTGIS